MASSSLRASLAGWVPVPGLRVPGGFCIIDSSPLRLGSIRIWLYNGPASGARRARQRGRWPDRRKGMFPLHGRPRGAVSDRRCQSWWPKGFDPARSGSRRRQDPAGEETRSGFLQDAYGHAADAARGIRRMRLRHTFASSGRIRNLRLPRYRRCGED